MKWVLVRRHLQLPSHFSVKAETPKRLQLRRQKILLGKWDLIPFDFVQLYRHFWNYYQEDNEEFGMSRGILEISKLLREKQSSASQRPSEPVAKGRGRPSVSHSLCGPGRPEASQRGGTAVGSSTRFHLCARDLVSFSSLVLHALEKEGRKGAGRRGGRKGRERWVDSCRKWGGRETLPPYNQWWLGNNEEALTPSMTERSWLPVLW